RPRAQSLGNGTGEARIRQWDTRGNRRRGSDTAVKKGGPILLKVGVRHLVVIKKPTLQMCAMHTGVSCLDHQSVGQLALDRERPRIGSREKSSILALPPTYTVPVTE